MEHPHETSKVLIKRHGLQPHPEGGWPDGDPVSAESRQTQRLDGAPLELQLRPAAKAPMAVVPAGWWQTARSQGAWSLVSCCVGPGFDCQDFELDPERHRHS